MSLWVHPACDFRRITLVPLFQDRVRLRLVAAGGQDDGGTEDKRSAEPCIGAQVFAEKLDAEIGTEGGLDVEEDARARSRDVMDALIPQERSSCGAGQPADR